MKREKSGLPSGVLQRAVRTTLLGAHQAIEARKVRDENMALGEVELQYQLEVSGTAEVAPSFASVHVDFDHRFYYAPGQRDSELREPHMWFGARLDADVHYSVHVRQWIVDPDDGAVIGCDLRASASAAVSTPYKGVVHVTIQGWGGLNEDETEISS
jgi:hypothetical protein